MRILESPLSEDTVRSLKLGEIVYINGPVITGRDEMHIRAIEKAKAERVKALEEMSEAERKAWEEEERQRKQEQMEQETRTQDALHALADEVRARREAEAAAKPE